MKAGIGMAAGAVGAFVGTPAEISLIRMTSDGRYVNIFYISTSRFVCQFPGPINHYFLIVMYVKYLFKNIHFAGPSSKS